MPTSKLVLQLDALMAVAHDIPALHRMEHPGDGASSLGADDFLPIFIYVLVNSRVDDLAAQSAVLETLCDPKKMMGEAGQSVFSGGSRRLRVPVRQGSRTPCVGKVDGVRRCCGLSKQILVSRRVSGRTASVRARNLGVL